MPVTEGSRDRMHQRLKEVLGDEPATTLMEHLPPKGWEDVATKGDLNHLREWVEVKLEGLRLELRADIAAVRGEVGAGIAAVRGELSTVRGELVAGIAAVRGELAREIGDVRGEIGNLRGEFHATLRTHTLAIIGAMAAFNGTMVALLR